MWWRARPGGEGSLGAAVRYCNGFREKREKGRLRRESENKTLEAWV